MKLATYTAAAILSLLLVAAAYQSAQQLGPSKSTRADNAYPHLSVKDTTPPQPGKDHDIYGNTRIWWWEQTDALPNGVGVYTYRVAYIAATHMAPLLEPGQVPWFGGFEMQGLP